MLLGMFLVDNCCDVVEYMVEFGLFGWWGWFFVVGSLNLVLKVNVEFLFKIVWFFMCLLWSLMSCFEIMSFNLFLLCCLVLLVLI